MPFSLKNEWSPDWPAGRVTTRSEIRVFYLSPTLAVKLRESLSLGMSLNVSFSKFKSARRIGFDAVGQPDGNQSLSGTGKTSFGFGAGILFHPDEVWSVGAAYRSQIAIPMKTARYLFRESPTEIVAFPDGEFSTKMTMPDHISAGIGCRPLDGLYLGGEAQYMLWSTLSSMSLTFADPSLRANPAMEDLIPLHWKNSFTARSGIEITLGDVSIRAGYAYEQSPVPDPYMRPSVPDASRNIYSGGIGYAVSQDLRIDFACSLARFKERTVTDSLVEYLPGAYLNGTYGFSLTIIGINMSYAWN